MKRLYAWLAGLAGGAAVYRAFRRQPPVVEPEPVASVEPDAEAEPVAVAAPESAPENRAESDTSSEEEE